MAIPERDAAIQKQCERFRDVTLQQLGVKASFVSYEVVPFIESISQLRWVWFWVWPVKWCGFCNMQLHVFDLMCFNVQFCIRTHTHTHTHTHRASYFSPTPTDKMYSVVEAARALYEQLNSMGESSIDGDSFLDLWIYVIIKANVKDLVSDLAMRDCVCRSMLKEYMNVHLVNTHLLLVKLSR